MRQRFAAVVMVALILPLALAVIASVSMAGPAYADGTETTRCVHENHKTVKHAKHVAHSPNENHKTVKHVKHVKHGCVDDDTPVAPAPKPPTKPAVAPKPTTTSSPTLTTKTVSVPKAAPAPFAAVEWSFTFKNASGGALVFPGDTLVITSAKLPPSAKVIVELHSTPVRLGSAIADASGDLSLTVTVPLDIEAGSHNLVAILTAPTIKPSMASVPIAIEEVVELEGTLAAGPPTPAPVAEPSSEDTRGFDDEHNGIADSLPTIFDIEVEPWKVATTGGLAAAFVLLAALPAELLESTLTENYGRAFGWLAPVRRRVARWQARKPRVLNNPWVGSSLAVGTAALILGFSDPTFGFNASSVRTFLALYLSLFLLNVAVGAIKISLAERRLRLPGHLTPMPGALIVAAVSVLVSRAMDISPSLLFGLVVGVSFARAQSKEVNGKLALVGVMSIFGIGIVSWVLFSLLVDVTGRGSGFLSGLLEESLAATALEALSVLLVGLLPFQYLEGKALHDWDQRIWAGMYFVAAAAFVFIAVPTGASWEESTAPVSTWLVICAGFGLISVAAWAAFRYIPALHEERTREGANV